MLLPLRFAPRPGGPNSYVRKDTARFHDRKVQRAYAIVASLYGSDLFHSLTAHDLAANVLDTFVKTR